MKILIVDTSRPFPELLANEIAKRLKDKGKIPADHVLSWGDMFDNKDSYIGFMGDYHGVIESIIKNFNDLEVIVMDSMMTIPRDIDGDSTTASLQILRDLVEVHGFDANELYAKATLVEAFQPTDGYDDLRPKGLDDEVWEAFCKRIVLKLGIDYGEFAEKIVYRAL